MIGQQKNDRILYHQNYHLIEKPVITFLKFRCISELSWKFLKNTNTQVFLYFFFCQSSRYISNEQPCLKTTGQHKELLLLSSLFHFFYFIFSAPISFSLCFPISPSFFYVLSQAFIKHSRKAFVYIYINNMYNVYVLENMNFCLTKKLMTF